MFGASSELASVMEFGREPASSCYVAASKLDEAKFQLRTSSELAPN